MLDACNQLQPDEPVTQLAFYHPSWPAGSYMTRGSTFHKIDVIAAKLFQMRQTVLAEDGSV